MKKCMMLLVLMCLFISMVSAEEAGVRLPYGGSSLEVLSTVGQLCKLSQLVMMSEVLDVRSPGELSANEIDLKPITVLYGSVSADVVTLVFASQLDDDLKTGTRVVVFASRKEFPFPSVNPLPWTFDEGTVKEKNDAPMRLLGGSRGLLHVEQNPEDLLNVMSSYLKHLRGTSRSSASYMEFLRGLAKHSNERFRQDAEADLFVCIRYRPEEDLQHMLSNGRIDANEKEYVRQILNWKHGASQKDSGPPIPADPPEVKLRRVQKLLESTNRTDRIAAFAEISKGKDSWAILQKDAWIEKAAVCLQDPDLDVRLSAASAMSAAGDRRAIAYLLEGMEHENIAYRAIVWKNLRAFAGIEIPEFDPKADAVEREKSISEIRAWCNKRKLLEESCGE